MSKPSIDSNDIPPELKQFLQRDTYSLLIRGKYGSGKTALSLTILRSLKATDNFFYISTRTSPTQLFDYYPWLSKFVKKQDSDYTDFLLATCLYRYSMVQDVYLMTADQRSMPPQIFTLKGALTIADREGHIHNLGVYCIDHGNFAKVARKLEQPR